LMVITNGGQVIRTRVSEIRETGRNTQGVRVIRLGDDEQVVDVEPVAEGEDDGGLEPAEESPEPEAN
ncbi:MAG: DNA gyrase C-terminal beta-propeller domain-containing protein, partial [Polyangiales bacterium]